MTVSPAAISAAAAVNVEVDAALEPLSAKPLASNARHDDAFVTSTHSM
jgi:hypothetical protein